MIIDSNEEQNQIEIQPQINGSFEDEETEDKTSNRALALYDFTGSNRPIKSHHSII